jgi:holliday junction DNA helicase RuvA
MIGRIQGILLEKTPPQLLVDCQGVGYKIDVPMSTFYHLPAIGAQVVLLIQMIVRDDAHLLYGFATAQERSIFCHLLKISGIGARIALAILSGMSVADLSQAVITQNAALLTRIPGVGKKTAERLVLELKGKLGAVSETGTTLAPTHTADILNALLALGYSEKEALTASKKIPADADLSAGIKQALKLLSKT